MFQTKDSASLATQAYNYVTISTSRNITISNMSLYQSDGA